MFKANELKAEFIRMGLKYRDVAKIIGISERGIYEKMNALTDWKYKELLSLRALIGVQKFNYIFFS